MSEIISSCDDVAFDDRWLSAAMFCATAAATFADAGLLVLLDGAAPFDPKSHLVFGPTAFDLTFHAALRFDTVDVTNVTEVDNAYKVNARFLLRGFGAWAWCDDFVNIINHTTTLTRNVMMVHKKGVGGVEWINGRMGEYSFDEKWNLPQRAMWFSPLFDSADANAPKHKQFDSDDDEIPSSHSMIAIRSSSMCVVTTRCVSGMVNIDSLGGFRKFYTLLKRMCADGGIRDPNGTFSGVEDPTVLTQALCTRFANSQGRLGDADIHAPIIVGAGFAGWVLKRQTVLERQILLFPRGRLYCEYWEMNGGLKKRVITPEFKQVLFGACQVHLIGALAAGIDHFNMYQTVTHALCLFGIDALKTAVNALSVEEKEQMLTYVSDAITNAYLREPAEKYCEFITLLHS